MPGSVLAACRKRLRTNTQTSTENKHTEIEYLPAFDLPRGMNRSCWLSLWGKGTNSLAELLEMWGLVFWRVWRMQGCTCPSRGAWAAHVSSAMPFPNLPCQVWLGASAWAALGWAVALAPVELAEGPQLARWDLQPKERRMGGVTPFSCPCLRTGCTPAPRWTSGAVALSSTPFFVALCLSTTSTSPPSSRRSGEVCFTSLNTSTAPSPLSSCTCCRLTPSSEQPSRTSGQPRWDGVGWLCAGGLQRTGGRGWWLSWGSSAGRWAGCFTGVSANPAGFCPKWFKEHSCTFLRRWRGGFCRLAVGDDEQGDDFI